MLAWTLDLNNDLVPFVYSPVNAVRERHPWAHVNPPSSSAGRSDLVVVRMFSG